MKKILLVITVFLFTSSHLFSNAQKGFNISGQIKNVSDSAIVTLFLQSKSAYDVVTSDTIIGGQFHLQGVSNTVPTRYLLVVSGKKFPSGTIDLWICNNDIKITGNSNLFLTWNVESELIEQKEQNSYVKAAKLDLDKIQNYSIEQKPLINEYMTAQEKNDSINLKKVNDKLDAIQEKINAVQKKVTLSDLKLMKKSKITTVWFSKLNEIASQMEPNDNIRNLVLEQYNRLSEVQKEKEARNVKNILFPKKIEIGDNMIDTALAGIDGKMHKLSDIKGKYILLDFWGKSCGPCMRSIPEMKEVVKKYEDVLQVVGISLDDKDVWEKASEEKGITWTNLNDGQGRNGGITEKYGVRGIPHYVLISPEYKIVDIWVGYDKGLLFEKMQKNLPNHQ